MPPVASNVEKIRDRRVNGRIPVGIPAELRDESFEYRGTVVDFSPGGLRVRVVGADFMVNSDYDLVLKSAGEAPVKLKGRVMHVVGEEAGLALAIGDLKVFESALLLYESLVFKDPKLALRLKRRPTAIDLTQKIWPLPLAGAVLSGPEHWVYGNLRSNGSLVSELRQAIGAEWARLTYVPFMLVERGLVSLVQPQQQVEDVPGKPIPRQQTGPQIGPAPGLKPGPGGRR